jgi:hypothetical protein
MGPFIHRTNSDSTFDSICLKCFATAGREQVESDLKQDEEAHVCLDTVVSRREAPPLPGNRRTKLS